MPTEESKAAILRIYERLGEALRSGDLDLIDDVIATDAVDHNLAPGEPGAGGRVAIKRAFGDFRKAFPDVNFVVDDIVAEGDKAACRLTMHGTHRGSFMGVAPTDRKVSQSGIDILRLSKGRIVERWGQSDDLGLLHQLRAGQPQAARRAPRAPRRRLSAPRRKRRR